MPTNITMPALSPTMEEGNLAKWLVKEGDHVAPGDVIAEIETDKATMEVEAVDEGTVAKILVPAGTEGVKVNAPIAVLAAEGEDVAAAAKSGGNGGAKAEKSKEPTRAQAPSTGPSGQLRPDGEKNQPAPAASQAGANDAATASSPRRGEGGSRSEPGEGASRTFASPLARRIAKEAGIDLTALNGSGPYGRVVKADVEAAVAGGAPVAKAVPVEAPSAPAAAPALAAKGTSEEAVLKLFEEGSYDRVPHDNMRKVIARRLVEAKTTIPHFYLSIDCDIDALLKLRKELNNAAPIRKTDKGDEPAYKLSVNDMVIKALALALIEVPDANVTWTDSAMLKHHHADVGVAVSIPGGLITPVIRHADEKTLSVISNEMKDFAARARVRKLKPEEYQGGTTAVSNLGMFGIKDFAAVINPPHATILAVGVGEQRAVVKNGDVKVATVMTVTLSTDHRAVDGALGAQLLSAFKRYVENPLGMLV